MWLRGLSPSETVEIKLIHKGCWSQLTGNYKVEAYQNWFLPYPTDNRNLAIISIHSASSMEFKEFARKFAKNYTVEEVIDVVKIPNSRNKYCIFFKGLLEGSVSGIMYENRIPLIKALMSNGYEVWRIKMFGKRAEISEQMENLIASLSEVSNISSIVKMPAQSNFNENYLSHYLIGNIFGLTREELSVLSKATVEGYFSYPRMITLDGLARASGKSKSYINRVLRRATMKIMHSLMSTLEPFI